MTPEESLRRFESIVTQPEEKINLAEAALLIATDEYPNLDIPYYLRALDAMADELRPRFNASAPPIDQITALNEYLFGALGLRGNQDAYYDPHNSYLNDVIDRRLGIPITLSVVYMEIGRRLGCPLSGVAMPGHFIVKWKTDEWVILIDVFDQGHVIGQFRLPQPAEVQSRLTWIESVGTRQMLVRMLNNLRLIFMQYDAHERTFRVLEKILVLQPDAPEALREAVAMAYKVQAYRRAEDFLRDYLARNPNANDAERMQTLLNQIEEILLRLN